MKRHLGLLSSFLIVSSALMAGPTVRAVDVTKRAIETEKSEKGSAPNSAKLDLNTATKAELEALPGVGPSIANEIVAARPFRSVEELRDIKGIGEERLNELRSRVMVPTSRETNAGPAGRTANREITGSEPTSRSEPSPGPTARASTAAKIDVNSANAESLESLPGVGPATAQAIISARPFNRVEELKEVKGIGDARYEQIRPLVVVRSAAAASPARPSIGSAPGTAKGTSTERPVASTSKGAEVKATGNTAGTKINVNTASREELESLLGIGPVKAQAIVEGRPYNNVEEVMKVKGIKEGTFSEIKDRIRVR